MELDVRGLEHKQRPPTVFAKLKEVNELTLIIEVEPLPLMQMLRSKGYDCRSFKENDYWKVEIKKKWKNEIEYQI